MKRDYVAYIYIIELNRFSAVSVNPWMSSEIEVANILRRRIYIYVDLNLHRRALIDFYNEKMIYLATKSFKKLLSCLYRHAIRSSCIGFSL